MKTETRDTAAVEAALCDKARTTRRLREITGLSLPRIRRALQILQAQRIALEVTVHYNRTGRGPLAHAPGWVTFHRKQQPEEPK